MAVSFKGAHLPKEIILMGVRWYVAYPLSTRHLEELMRECGVNVDHSTVNRRVIKYSLQLEEAFHRRKRPVWVSWRMDETYIRVQGEWHYLYCNEAAIKNYNTEHGTTIVIHQVKYLNSIVEQDHRAVKRMICPTSGSSPSQRHSAC